MSRITTYRLFEGLQVLRYTHPEVNDEINGAISSAFRKVAVRPSRLSTAPGSRIRRARVANRAIADSLLACGWQRFCERCRVTFPSCPMAIRQSCRRLAVYKEQVLVDIGLDKNQFGFCDLTPAWSWFMQGLLRVIVQILPDSLQRACISADFEGHMRSGAEPEPPEDALPFPWSSFSCEGGMRSL